MEERERHEKKIKGGKSRLDGEVGKKNSKRGAAGGGRGEPEG